MNKIFPDGFLWGAATSAHQVEGNNRNNWTEWEKANAKRLAKEARTYWQPWQREVFPEMLTPENYISGKACDHYNRYEEDFNLAKEMGHNAHRFSIEWSRIEPEEGKFDEKEIEHYRRVILALRERGIEPFVTLWHWTMPIWFVEIGAFSKKDNIKYFVRFCETIVKEFCSDVKFWIVLNEPEIYAGNSHLKGIWPPQKKSLISYFLAIKNLIKAHRNSYKIIKKIIPNAQVGIAKNNIYFEAYQNKIHNRILKKFIDWWWNFYFLNRIKNHQDFIGLNHYFHNRIKSFRFNKNENKKVSDMGWELYPEAIPHVLKDLKKYNKPIYITENGLADGRDKNREWFIKESLKNIHKAIEDGADIRGYFYWSLLDNFEWDKGFWPRFGLVEIDYKTLERKPRPSSYIYAEIAKNNSINNAEGERGR
ncbi:MAG: glycoside hydrolase family 1 protein [Parcubacteria group bacterium]|nr:glycoside hydrolase family 1 protein [Parcubacteria group bacterium]